MTTLQIEKPVYDAIRAHGEETYPHECCGALLGRSLQKAGGSKHRSRPVIHEPTRRTTGIRFPRRNW
jgi:proteasome lid subunit RPN8/RPN11